MVSFPYVIRLSWKDLVTPVADLARQGFPVTGNLGMLIIQHLWFYYSINNGKPYIKNIY